MIRKPIITVMGQVDSGKTSLLDCIRGTAMAQKEVGGITQYIGSTEISTRVIEKIAGKLIQKFGFELKIPGLLFIDTPGHEAFTNLRKRGGSIADLAILVVDIQKGLQQQTIESIEILKTYKTPFIVAANKIDLISGWVKTKGSFTENVPQQNEDSIQELDKKIYELVGQLHSLNFVSERFDRVRDYTKEVAIIPASAKFFEGIPEVLLFLAGLSQKYLGKKLNIYESENAKGTVLEVKEEKGFGKTIDTILYEGKLSVGDEIAIGGKNGVILTKIRALLEPTQPEELRSSKEKFKNTKEVFAAAGAKIAAPHLEDALAGSPLRINSNQAVKEIEEEIQRVKIDTENTGPILKADALGSLEALIKLLEAKRIRVRKADVGNVSRHDIIQAQAVKEKDSTKGVVFAFHTKINEDAANEAKKNGVKIFEGNIIYDLIEKYFDWMEIEKEQEKSRLLKRLVLPSKIFVMPNHVFRHSKPAIVGIRIEQGTLKTDVQLMKNGKIIGKVNEIQLDGKSIEEAKKTMEVAVSISGATVGKNINEKDELYSFIPKKHLEELGKMKDFFKEEELELLEKIKELEKRELEAKK
ncbi:MAG: translation initiation factor IF-2 [Candidatus Diapherotrites archaeon]|nr:translation initiation factor IF-2 [Candidatus Diapherotrites archaeon]